MAVTMEQLQQELAALKAQVDGITAPPTDYYTSRWSGEEIDNGVARALPGGAIDTALGDKLSVPAIIPDGKNFDEITDPGMYYAPYVPTSANKPSATYNTYALIVERTDAYGAGRTQRAISFDGKCVWVRASYINDAGAWSDWQQLATTSQLCNPNLLDNWYFVGGGGPGQFPVNQRGQTEYTGNGYCIDRWLFSGTVTLEADGILIKQSSTEFFMKKLPNEILNAIRGKVITISFAYIDGGLKIATSTFTVAPYGDIDSPEIAVGNVFFDLYKYGEDVARIRFFSVNTGNSIKLAAVKLELGSHQTLAHKEGDTWVLNEIPNYAEQLARCQRYQLQVIADKTATNNVVGSGVALRPNLVQAIIAVPVTMRTTPAISIVGELHLVSRDGDITTITGVKPLRVLSAQNCIMLEIGADTPLQVGQSYLVYMSKQGGGASMLFDANL